MIEQISKKLGTHDADFAKLLNFLPYPFVISEIQRDVRRNFFINEKFLEEIGYTVDDVPTLEDWFQQAYPDSSYRQNTKDEWSKREDEAINAGQDFVMTKSKIYTKKGKYIWYEVKASIHGSIRFIAFININEEFIQKEELERLNENKNRVLSILSHDLRGPLNNLHRILQLNTNELLSELEKVEVFKKLKIQVFQLSEFLDTTLHWARLNFSQLILTRQILDVKKITDSVLNFYSSLSINKNIQTTVSITNATEVYGNPEVLSIVFRNLISNAIKFTPVNGTIRVYDSHQNDKYVLTVENSGTGIGQEKIAKILSKEHISETGTLGERGLGLGLKLCIQLLEKNGNKLEIESLEEKRAAFRLVI